MPSPGRYDGRPMRRLRARVKREEPICWLCGQPIDPDLRSPHPLSFSLDHKHVVSRGGAELDRRNCRAAHRICNMRRGTGTPHQQAPRHSRDW